MLSACGFESLQAHHVVAGFISFATTFYFKKSKPIRQTFEIILNDFSVSQIYGIIWRAVTDASKLYLEKGISKKHAANSVIGARERYAERAKINGWDLGFLQQLFKPNDFLLSIPWKYHRFLALTFKIFCNAKIWASRIGCLGAHISVFRHIITISQRNTLLPDS